MSSSSVAAVVTLQQRLEQQSEGLRGLRLLSWRSPPCTKRIRVSHLTLWPVPVQLCVTTPPHSGACLSSLDPAYGPHSLPPSLQTDVDPAHLSSLAQPPSIMGFFFFLKTRSEQEGIQRDGMQPATTPPTGSFLHQLPLHRWQFETRNLTQN